MVAETATLTGRLTGQSVTVLGRFTGQAAAHTIRVGASGQVSAELRSEQAEVLGRFEGRIDAKVLRFGPTAKAQGAFFFEKLSIEDGALVDGSFNTEVTSPADDRDGEPSS